MYFKQIDSFRFVAVLFVLASHWLAMYPAIDILKWGKMGVDFFFVISGFLITLQLISVYKYKLDAKEITLAQSLKVFYLRRVLRILPLYYLVMISATLIVKGEMMDAFWWNFAHVSNFYFIHKHGWAGVFSHFWSLSVEEHFYLVWPLLVLLSSRKSLPYFMMIIGLFAVSYRCYIYYNYMSLIEMNIHTFACLDQLMIGAGLAYFYAFHKTRFKKVFSSVYVKIFSFAALGMIMLLLWYKTGFAYFDKILIRTLWGLVFGFIVGSAAVGYKGISKTILENKFLVRMGKISYGIYLTHNFVPDVLMPNIYLNIKYWDIHPMIKFTGYFIVTIIGSEILYRLVENPFRKLYPKLKPIEVK